MIFPAPPVSCNGFYYTVQPGDTLFLIAQRFGVSLAALIAANPQIPNPNLIFPGQVICVPTGIQTVECCMLLFRTANIPLDPTAPTGGVARIYQTSGQGSSVLVSAIGLPTPQSLGGNIFVAWVRRTTGTPIPFQLLQTGPVITEPGVYVGALVLGINEVIAPFQDIVVTAELEFPVTTPNLNRIALIGYFNQCRPR